MYWPLDQTWYDAKITAFDHNGRHCIEYSDGTMKEFVHLHKQTFKWKDGKSIQMKLDKQETLNRKNNYFDSVGLMINNELNDGIYEIGCLRENMKGGSSSGNSISSRNNKSSISSNMDEGVKPWTTVLQSRQNLQPILDHLMSMKFNIPVDVTCDDERLRGELENIHDCEQNVLFNPFYYLVSKAKIGSDGLTRKDIEVQKAIKKNLERIEKEGKIYKGYKRGGKKKGGIEKLKTFRLPSYFEIVHRSMSLQKIQRKLGTVNSSSSSSSNTLIYNTYGTFYNDVRLMASNAKSYYSNRNHAIHRAANKILNECKRLIELSKDGKFKKIKNENSGGKKTSSKRKATKSDTGIENEAKRSRGQTTGRVRAKVERYGMKQ